MSQGLPFAHELFDRCRDLKVITDQLGEPGGRTGAEGEQSRVIRQRVDRHATVALHAAGADSSQIEEMGAQSIFGAMLGGGIRPVSLPGPMKERQRPMVKQVKEVAEGRIARPRR